METRLASRVRKDVERLYGKDSEKSRKTINWVFQQEDEEELRVFQDVKKILTDGINNIQYSDLPATIDGRVLAMSAFIISTW